MPSSAVLPDLQSQHALEHAVTRSGRRTGIQLPIGFIAGKDPAADPPLARMLRGGRGGEVRVKLYLCLTLIAAAPPYDLRLIPARSWARMLALPDPEKAGARRISDALNWLEKAKLVSLTRQAGAPPVIKLLSPLGTGHKYTRPTVRWVTVPLGLWRQQWITRLSGSGLALLLVLLELQGGKSSARPPTLAGGRQGWGQSPDRVL
jgi:hypothetical protein